MGSTIKLAFSSSPRPSRAEVKASSHLKISEEPVLHNARSTSIREEPEEQKTEVTLPVPVEPPPTQITTVTPLYKQRLVMLKIGNNFLKVGAGNRPVLRSTPNPVPKNFNFQDFTFYADESASMTESWYKNARAFFNIRLGVQRQGEDGLVEYLCALRTPECMELMYDKQSYGSWWRLTAVAANCFLAESVLYPGYCLTRGRFGLQLTGPVTDHERAGLVKGKLDEARTLSIVHLPDFAVWKASVIVN